MKIVYIGQLYNNTYYVNEHRHDYWEIVYYTKGQGTVNINGELIDFTENDFFAIPPTVPHFDYSDNGFTNYHFNFLDNEFHFDGYLKLHDTEDRSFLKVLTLMNFEYHNKRPGYAKITDSLFYVLRSYIDSFLNKESEYENPYVNQIIGAIIENLSNPDFSVSDILKTIPMHKDHIRRIFIKETGVTPLKFLTQKRLAIAKKLLGTKDKARLTLKEISHMCGYSDYYYFSRVFKQYFGQSPKEWLKNNA